MEYTTVDQVLAYHKEQCESAISAFRRELQKMRTGRASSGLLEGIIVDYYGAKTQLSHLGQISIPEARTIVIQVYDVGAVEAIEKAIRISELGLNPGREGNTIRVNIPTLTQETRKELVRHLNKLAEEIRVSVRSHRREANDLVKKLEKASSNPITQDESKRAADKIQKITDSYTEQVDSLLKVKETECMEV